MYFWIILVKGDGDKWFRPVTYNFPVEVYRTKFQAREKLKEAKAFFGSKNAYLQKIGAIS